MASNSKLYTKTGDQGISSLFNGRRLEKDDLAFDALGHIDELNSIIGVVREFLGSWNDDTMLSQQLVIIQSRLLDLGSAVATPLGESSNDKIKRTRLDPRDTKVLEHLIDAMDEDLPPLQNFILPSGGKAASFLHVARSVCRRAERAVVALARNGCLDPEVMPFLNRLSDFLFMAARWVAMKEGKPETVYKKNVSQ